MQYDLFSPQFKANPFPTFARMREEAPLYLHRSPSGQHIWYVTRYDDVISVLKDSDRFVEERAQRLFDETPAKTFELCLKSETDSSRIGYFLKLGQ